MKRVRKPFFNLSLRLAAELEGSCRLRLHCDYDQEESALVYPYLRGTLLGLIQKNPDFPVLERKKILRLTGEAIQELHDNDWIHIDVKPDNILVDWTCDKEGCQTVTNVALGDFDIAFKSKDGEPRNTPFAIGNAMWRSPEGQTGRGVTKASDVFSFGLVCIYALGGQDFILIDDYAELAKCGMVPEQEILVRHFSYFGLVSKGLLEAVNSEDWCRALKETSKTAEVAVQEHPGLRFESWGAGAWPAGSEHDLWNDKSRSNG